MSDQIKIRLDEMKSEVNDFHPFLEALFTKMDKINHVQYTHGQHEMGADFVLTTVDGILGTPKYIGVIVKIGKILQNTTEIERQIGECAIARNIGKEEIYLNEVWVVSNSTISHNAQVKLHDRYKHTNISFLDRGNIVKLTSKYYAEFAANVNVLVEGYLNEVRLSNIETEKKTSLLTISGDDVFIDQSIIKVDDDRYNQTKKINTQFKRKTEKIIDVINKNDFMLIEGQMGSGKSKLLRKVCNHFADNANYIEEARLPIQTMFHEIIDKYECNISSLIADTTKNIGDSLDTDKFIIIIDGVDEVDKGMDERIENIKLLSKFANNKIKIILAGRTIDDPDVEVKIKNAITRYEICPVSFGSMVKFIEKTCAQLNVSNRILDDLSHSPLLKVLPRTPIAAILIAKLLNENSQEIPSNMTELYSKYTELCMGRWDIEDKGFKTQKEYVSSSEIIANIAVYMIDNELHEISQDEAKDFFREYLNKRNLGIDVNELFDGMLSRCEIVYRNNRKKTISFKHKSFAEYYYAKNIEKLGNIDINEKSFDLYWSNIVFFYVGLKRDCPELLTKLIDYNTEDDKLKLLKLINLGNFLLAGFATPYETIEKGVHHIFGEAAQFYCDISNKKSESFLANFTAMQLLSLMRAIMYDGYAYEFFKNAIDSSITKVYGNNDVIEKKAIELFLLNIAYIEAGGDSQLDILIDQIGDSLPLSITLALDHEVNDLNLKEFMPAMKKISNKLKKQAKHNASIRHAIENLYDKPLDKLKIT